MHSRLVKDGRRIYELGNGPLKIQVIPKLGMNITRIEYGRHRIVDWDKERYDKRRLFGVPVLFPTPNRVRDGRFIFDGRSYPGRMHGLVRNAPLRLLQSQPDLIEGCLSIGRESKFYSLFPFDCKLTIRIVVRNNAIEWFYRLQNRDGRLLPYGLGLHPFWRKIGRTRITVNAHRLLEKDRDMTPNGRSFRTAGTDYDLGSPVDLEGLDLDHYFTDLEKPETAVIDYRDIGLRIGLEASEEFDHFVVYTPADKPYFCLENQSCSCDAHNLYHRGYKELSGLRILEPGGTAEGSIRYCFRTKDYSEK